jgi:protein-S-isoprenylcysteine O-methyltransferase Ste14
MTIGHVVPYLLFVGMMGGELYASSSRRSDGKVRDRGSLVIVRLATLAGYVAGFAWWELHRSAQGEPPIPALAAGTVLTAAGMALRMWCVHLLGPCFTVDVRVSPEQRVITTGPYALLRHPSYLGGILMAIGIGLAMGSTVTPIIIVVPQFLGLAYRMRVEEAALLEVIGEPYKHYCDRTKRLFPFLW